MFPGIFSVELTFRIEFAGKFCLTKRSPHLCIKPFFPRYSCARSRFFASAVAIIGESTDGPQTRPCKSEKFPLGMAFQPSNSLSRRR